MQPNVWYDPAMKKWRAWYSAFTSCSKPLHTIPYCDNQPQQCGSVAGSSKAGRGSGFLYAESDDGLTWYKPSLVRQPFFRVVAAEMAGGGVRRAAVNPVLPPQSRPPVPVPNAEELTLPLDREELRSAHTLAHTKRARRPGDPLLHSSKGI